MESCPGYVHSTDFNASASRIQIMTAVRNLLGETSTRHLRIKPAEVTSASAATICRWVCPDLIGGTSPLQEEGLYADGSAQNCVWYGGGLGLRFASFDSNGDVIPGSQSSNNQFTTRAQQYCTNAASGWTWEQGQICLVDPVSPRLLTRDTMVPISGGASPEACTAACDARGFTYAGVEYAAECHCGTGFTTTPSAVPHTHCNMACAGNSSEKCGGSALITVFAGPNPPRAAQLPSGWSAYAAAPCAQDSAARMFINTLAAGAALADINTPAACVNFCIQHGFSKAGVEGGGECYCGNTFRATPQALSPSQCNLPCQGAIGINCGGNWAIQLYTS